MVHGLTGNLAVWHLRIVPELAEHFRVLTYDLRGHGLQRHAADPATAPDAMADDLLELLDALEIERPVIVGHSYGADIALYHALRHPDRVREVIAIEAALPALEQSRRHDGWVGWSYWARALEEAGHAVPPEKRSDLRYMIRATIDLPEAVGAAEGPAAQPEAAAAPARRDDAARGLPAGRHADARARRLDRDAGRADVRRAVGLHRHLRVPQRAPAERAGGADAEHRMGPLRPAGATRGWSPRHIAARLAGADPFEIARD